MFYTLSGEFLGYGLYNGTVDVQQPWVSHSREDAWSYTHDEEGNRRSWEEQDLRMAPEWDKVRACAHKGQPCICYSQYGYGFSWSGTYCPECRVFLGPHNSDSIWEISERGHPFAERYPEHDVVQVHARWLAEQSAKSEGPESP